MDLAAQKDAVRIYGQCNQWQSPNTYEWELKNIAHLKEEWMRLLLVARISVAVSKLEVLASQPTCW